MSDDKVEEDTGNIKVLAVHIKDSKVLYSAYMDYLESGGLFIPTKSEFSMGEKIKLKISILDESLKHTIDCKVVWITPPGAQGNKAAGIGVHFGGVEGESLRLKIEQILGDDLQTGRGTHTM